MNFWRLRIDYVSHEILTCMQRYIYSLYDSVTHYGDMQVRILWDSLYATEEQRTARARGHWMHSNSEDNRPIRWFPPLWCSMRHISPFVVYSFCLRLSSEFVWIQCPFALRHFSTCCAIFHMYYKDISVQWALICTDKCCEDNALNRLCAITQWMSSDCFMCASYVVTHCIIEVVTLVGAIVDPYH